MYKYIDSFFKKKEAIFLIQLCPVHHDIFIQVYMVIQTCRNVEVKSGTKNRNKKENMIKTFTLQSMENTHICISMGTPWDIKAS